MKIILIAMLCIVGSALNAQISGLGPFKIGDSPQRAIDTINSRIDIKMKRVGVLDFGLQTGDSYSSKPKKYLFKDTLMPATNDKYLRGTSERKELSTEIYVDYIDIAGISVRDLKLQYYNDSLIKISSSSTTDLGKAFDEKYGEGKRREEKRKVTCTNAIAGNYDLEESTFYSNWSNTVKGVEAISIISSYYDSKCRKSGILLFVIQNTEATKRLRDAETTYRESLIKKPTLSDL